MTSFSINYSTNSFFKLFNKEFSNIIILEDDFMSGIGSEDFAYFTHLVPSIMINVVSGDINKGYIYPLHNENVIFDEKCLIYGTMIYTYFACNI